MSISTKNLMIGNIVNDRNGFTMKVVAIFGDEVYLDFEGNEGDVWEESGLDLKPYEITEKFLLDIGAQEIEWFDFPKYNLHGMQISIIEDVWFEYVHQVRLQGLHHLQNLYLLTRGQELILPEGFC